MASAALTNSFSTPDSRKSICWDTERCSAEDFAFGLACATAITEQHKNNNSNDTQNFVFIPSPPSRMKSYESLWNVILTEDAGDPRPSGRTLRSADVTRCNTRSFDSDARCERVLTQDDIH